MAESLTVGKGRCEPKRNPAALANSPVTASRALRPGIKSQYVDVVDLEGEAWKIETLREEYRVTVSCWMRPGTPGRTASQSRP